MTMNHLQKVDLRSNGGWVTNSNYNFNEWRRI